MTKNLRLENELRHCDTCNQMTRHNKETGECWKCIINEDVGGWDGKMENVITNTPSEQLYKINAYLSQRTFIEKRALTLEELGILNDKLGKIIKEIRKMEDSML